MKAAIIERYQAPIEIGTVATPRLEDDSVLLAVHAAGINPIDDILRSGDMKDRMPLTFPHVMGYDVSGMVVDVGKDVTRFQVGDAVFARPNLEDAGAIAEFARVKASELAHKPESLRHVEAAAVPLAGLTAWQALIARHVGAHIATTCSGRNADLVRSLGADVVIDYKTENFDEQLSDYDLVLDMLGGDILNRSFKVLKQGGMMVSIKGQDTEKLAPKFGVRFEWFLMEPDGAMLGELGRLIDAGAVKPVVGRTFPMEQSAAAYEELENGHAAGKIVVTVGSADSLRE